MSGCHADGRSKITNQSASEGVLLGRLKGTRSSLKRNEQSRTTLSKPRTTDVTAKKIPLTSENTTKMPSIESYDNANGVAARKMKSSEEKVAYELARDFIGYKLGKGNRLNTKTAVILRKLSNQIELKHELLLRNMCDRMDIRDNTAGQTFRQVADEIFSDGINWGRIVVLYTFAGKIATYCRENHLEITDSVAGWVGSYVSQKSDWIKKSGGWDAFNEQFKDVQEEHEKFWWNSLLCTTLGLGSLAALLYMKS